MTGHFLALFFVLAGCAALSQEANADQSCASADPTTISAVFKNGISLNERFKKSAAKADETEYRALRTEVETFLEERLDPCLERATSMLSRSSNVKLSQSLLELVVSFENSADEAFSYALGKIFCGEPKGHRRGDRPIAPQGSENTNGAAQSRLGICSQQS